MTAMYPTRVSRNEKEETMSERFGEPDPCCCPCGCCDEDTIHSEIRVKFSGIGSRLGSAEWDREDGFIVTLEDGIVLVDECVWTGSGPGAGEIDVHAHCWGTTLHPFQCPNDPEKLEGQMHYWTVNARVPGGSGTGFRNDVLVRSCLALSELVPMDCSPSVSFENPIGESCVISPVVP